MILAAISFSDPVMLAGLAAAGIPVALHLLNRIRSPIVPFPTLRFLKITAMKTSRRRQIQQYLLLLLRMAVFAMIAMAISRPLIRGGSSTLAYSFVVVFLLGLGVLLMAAIWGAEAVRKKNDQSAAATTSDKARAPSPTAGAARYITLAALAAVLAALMLGGAVYGLASDRYFAGDKGEFNGRSTAVVVVLDNSYSMLAREDAATRFQRAKEQTREILSQTIAPAEAGIVVTNPGGAALGEDRMTSDITQLIGYVDKLQVVGRANPMKERIHHAAEMLLAAPEAGKMLIVVSDFARNAFDDAEVFDAIKDLPDAKNLQVILMPMAKASPPADVGISSFDLADGGAVPVVGNEIVFQAQMVNNGDAGEARTLEFLVDDNVVASIRPRVQLGAGGTESAHATIKIPYRLRDAGPHRFTLRLPDAKDAVEWDDQRELSLDVAQQVKVLVVGDQPTLRPRSAAFYFLAALAPFGSQNNGAAGTPWSILPTYRGAAAVQNPDDLAGYSAVFMCDVPRISDSLAASLARYAGDGGRIVWILGASVDGQQYNQTVLAKNRDLLPGPLGSPVTSPAGSLVDWVDLQSPLFANLFDNQEPFRTIVVTGRWSLQANTLARGKVLGKLADGNIFMAQHSLPAGGDIYTLFTSPSADWSNLGATVLLVPLASRMALGDSGRSKIDTSYAPGDNLLIHVPGADRTMRSVTLDVTTPTAAVINCRPVMSGDIPRWYFDKTQTVGLYHWRASDHKHAGIFVVNPPAEEVELLQADVAALAREVPSNRAPIIAASAPELLTQLQKQSEGATLAPGILAMVLILAILEALLANRTRPANRRLMPAVTAAA